ncbi:nuclear transport factor 2 family protein [Streptomyces sp. WMMC897]|uniref:nuclear transport factor 2 family protein n=1 Tax=Streptomyces sp. WMMC897 TaxID=3014782 RepID=UPI0022B62E0A|nr:nuclear transport factor 2 family protein [Streptomyces sp. WMMC897]MCZ7415088.1 nuclear transport factor 2 family protein [Streptomyces sp. WMMC897]
MTSGGSGDDTEAAAAAVEAANRALYDALEQGDYEALAALWLDGDVSVVHPGWPVLRGRGEVLRSYALIMANTEYIQFFLTDVEVSVVGDAALVTCTENILSGGPSEADGSAGELIGGLVVATNVFRRDVDGVWRVWSHHGSPVIAEDTDEPDDAAAADPDGDVGEGSTGPEG